MKDKIINFLKLFLLIFTMDLGIFYTGVLIWVVCGLPQTTWAICSIAIASGLLELAYIKWVSETDNL